MVEVREGDRSGKLVESSDRRGCALQRKDVQFIASRADGCILFAVGVPRPRDIDHRRTRGHDLKREKRPIKLSSLPLGGETLTSRIVSETDPDTLGATNGDQAATIGSGWAEADRYQSVSAYLLGKGDTY